MSALDSSAGPDKPSSLVTNVGATRVRLILVLLSALGIVQAVRTKVTVDRLSVEAGVPLPRTERSKLRHSYLPERQWMRQQGYEDRDPSTLDEHERAELQEFVDKEHATYSLKQWLGTWGLLQYPLCLACLVLAALGSLRAFAGNIADVSVRVLLGVIACYLWIDAWNHAYVDSLGW